MGGVCELQDCCGQSGAVSTNEDEAAGPLLLLLLVLLPRCRPIEGGGPSTWPLAGCGWLAGWQPGGEWASETKSATPHEALAAAACKRPHAARPDVVQPSIEDTALALDDT